VALEGVVAEVSVEVVIVEVDLEDLAVEDLVAAAPEEIGNRIFSKYEYFQIYM